MTTKQHRVLALTVWALFATIAAHGPTSAQVVPNEGQLTGIWRHADDQLMIGDWYIRAGDYTVLDIHVSDSVHIEKNFYTVHAEGCAPVRWPGGPVYAGENWWMTTRYLDDTVDLHLSPYRYYNQRLQIVEYEPQQWLRLHNGIVWEYMGRILRTDDCLLYTGKTGTNLRDSDGNIDFPGVWSKDSLYFVELRPDGQIRLVDHTVCQLLATGTWSVEGNRFSSKVPGRELTYDFEPYRNETWKEDLLLMGPAYSKVQPFGGYWTIRTRELGAYPCGTPTLD